MQPLWKFVLTFTSTLLFSAAQAQPVSGPNAAAADPKLAFEDARKFAKPGPVDVPLASQAVLKLPTGYVFIAQPQATALLRAMGNPGLDPRLLGLIQPPQA